MAEETEDCLAEVVHPTLLGKVLDLVAEPRETAGASDARAMYTSRAKERKNCSKWSCWKDGRRHG